MKYNLSKIMKKAWEMLRLAKADNRIVTSRKTWDSAIKAAECFLAKYEIAC